MSATATNLPRFRFRIQVLNPQICCPGSSLWLFKNGPQSCSRAEIILIRPIWLWLDCSAPQQFSVSPLRFSSIPQSKSDAIFSPPQLLSCDAPKTLRQSRLRGPDPFLCSFCRHRFPASFDRKLLCLCLREVVFYVYRSNSRSPFLIQPRLIYSALFFVVPPVLKMERAAQYLTNRLCVYFGNLYGIGTMSLSVFVSRSASGNSKSPLVPRCVPLGSQCKISTR
ncbi:hypothetical protein DFH06DRAFT_1203063 [Mycena polygramma]|nr:hypothetical protein DFH06DRAFT_1203063 [Mycena polygramma]